jgi:hypothetical protein
LEPTAVVARPVEYSNLRSPGVKPGWDATTRLSLLSFQTVAHPAQGRTGPNREHHSGDYSSAALPKHSQKCLTAQGEGQRCEAFSGEDLLVFRPKGPFDCLARAIGPGKPHQQLTRPEGPFVCCKDKWSTLWALEKTLTIAVPGRWPGLGKLLGLWPGTQWKTAIREYLTALGEGAACERCLLRKPPHPAYRPPSPRGGKDFVQSCNHSSKNNVGESASSSPALSSEALRQNSCCLL